LIGGRQEFSISLWVIFAVLMALGLLVVWRQVSVPGQEVEGSPAPPRLKRAFPVPRRRRTIFILLGSFLGLVLSATLIFVVDRGGSSGCSAAGHPVVVCAASPDGGDKITDVIAVTVNVTGQPPAGYTYWLLTEFRNVFGVEIFKVQQEVPAAPGSYHFQIPIISASVHSTRMVYVMEADQQATPAMEQNRDAPSDNTRDKLPSAGVDTVSNSVTVIKQAP
jgi:hypothetical protein